MRPERASALAVTAGIALRPVRPMSDNAQVLALPYAMRTDALQSVVDRLRGDPSVEYAYVDAREHLMAIPNDPLFAQQTYMQTPGATPLVASANVPGAWDVTKGTSAAVIAVVDGGVRFDHPDLAGRLLPGYDLVSADCTPGTGGCTVANQFTTANDGDGRDPDASDPGDWVTAAEIASNPNLSKCGVEQSTWHGTHIAGIVGAAGNNGIGIAGFNWNAA
ncbi:MAG: S8 family serine peptidase, partial [Pseudomonadota bacterium]|nr:S8 family serine peptidase [Pseudomonadota bacterium]